MGKGPEREGHIILQVGSPPEASRKTQMSMGEEHMISLPYSWKSTPEPLRTCASCCLGNDNRPLVPVDRPFQQATVGLQIPSVEPHSISQPIPESGDFEAPVM